MAFPPDDVSLLSPGEDVLIDIDDKEPLIPFQVGGVPGGRHCFRRGLPCFPSPVAFLPLRHHTASIRLSRCSLVAGHLTDGGTQLGASSRDAIRVAACGKLCGSTEQDPKHLRKMALPPCRPCGGLAPGDHPGNQGGRSKKERRKTG